MRRTFALGLALVTLMYVAPFFYTAYTGQAASLTASQSQEPVESDASRISAEWKPQSAAASVQDENPKETTDTKPETDPNTIRALIDGKVKTLPLETYVAGVVASEMPASFPEEALKCQAIAARTYLVYKIQNGGASESVHQGADVCSDSTHCTAYTDLSQKTISAWKTNRKKYQSAVEKAVKATKGQILTYNGAPILAVFHAASGDQTESAADVWGTDIPYLQSVSITGGEDCSAFHDSVTVSAADFRKRMGDRYTGIYLKGQPSTWFTASKRSKAGGIITATCGGVTVKGTDIRRLFGLHSTNFKLQCTADAITFVHRLWPWCRAQPVRRPKNGGGRQNLYGNLVPLLYRCENRDMEGKSLASACSSKR